MRLQVDYKKQNYGNKSKDCNNYDRSAEVESLVKM